MYRETKVMHTSMFLTRELVLNYYTAVIGAHYEHTVF